MQISLLLSDTGQCYRDDIRQGFLKIIFQSSLSDSVPTNRYGDIGLIVIGSGLYSLDVTLHHIIKGETDVWSLLSAVCCLSARAEAYSASNY